MNKGLGCAVMGVGVLGRGKLMSGFQGSSGALGGATASACGTGCEGGYMLVFWW